MAMAEAQDISRRAFELAIPEAEALGHGWLGELHILLGICRSDGPARRALESVGITHQRVVEAANELLKGSASDPDGAVARAKWSFNPAGAKALNWADGFATGSGTARRRPPARGGVVGQPLLHGCRVPAS
jgi:hypothetical protein